MSEVTDYRQQLIGNKLKTGLMYISLLENSYAGKKVFVTGHTGFKGSWLLQWLHILGAEVKGYSLEPETPNDLYNVIDGSSLCESVIGDVLDKKKLEDAILSFQPDYIFHLAAQPLVRLSYDFPTETFAVNALGTANLLDAVRILEKECVVILITTDKVYKNEEWIYAYRENDQLGGQDPYSASKACAEIIINSYAQSFFSPETYPKHEKALASTRAGNVIGGGDWSKDRIIPDIVRALKENKPVTVRNPDAVRPWQHVLEPLGGYLLLGAHMKNDPLSYTGSWNFGPLIQDNIRVEDLVQTAIQIWGTGKYKKPALLDQPYESNLLKLDINKALSLINWIPKLNSTEAIELTISWYKTFLYNKEYIKTLTLNQIQNYMKNERIVEEKFFV